MPRSVIFSAVALSLFLSACRTASSLSVNQESPVRSIERGEVVFRDGRSVKLPYSDDPNATLLVLVRHAEKGNGEDPNLTSEGVRRALLLSDILQGLSLEVVYTTDFKRTIQTSEPTALRQHVPLKQYTPSNLATLAYKLSTRYKGKSVLVVGHSDTTPELINTLVGKELVARIPEYEYNKLYVMLISGDKHKEVLELACRLEAENID
ncbi:MAG: histidine phosphatase family protein [Phaeodactylibacter sp.]|nr:histidine phosphatase family protein [Phaeodactylibacter sp.]MCB9277176.1 histidine phosphatase family protein [Lewinellaceae bacterium]